MRAGPATSPEELDRMGRYVWVWLALAALAGWTLFLVLQTIRTANPIVVSVPQILSSPFVVVGEAASTPGQFAVRQVLRGETLAAPMELSVLDLEVALRSAGVFSQYVLPLEPVGDGSYRVTPIPASEVPRSIENPRPVYPWNDAVKAQIERALGRAAESGALSSTGEDGGRNGVKRDG